MASRSCHRAGVAKSGSLSESSQARLGFPRLPPILSQPNWKPPLGLPSPARHPDYTGKEPRPQGLILSCQSLGKTGTKHMANHLQAWTGHLAPRHPRRRPSLRAKQSPVPMSPTLPPLHHPPAASVEGPHGPRAHPGYHCHCWLYLCPSPTSSSG